MLCSAVQCSAVWDTGAGFSGRTPIKKPLRELVWIPVCLSLLHIYTHTTSNETTFPETQHYQLPHPPPGPKKRAFYRSFLVVSRPHFLPDRQVSPAEFSQLFRPLNGPGGGTVMPPTVRPFPVPTYFMSASGER